MIVSIHRVDQIVDQLVDSRDARIVRLKFTDNVGRFVFHCHILEHEDAGMMAQFEVVP